MHIYTNVAINAIREASKIIVRYQSRIHQFSKENPIALVAKLAEEIIIHNLTKDTKTNSFYAPYSNIDNREKSHQWVINAIDGNANYIRGYPYYCISLVLIEKNKLVLAVIYDPIKNNLYSCTKGDGAYFNDRRIRTKLSKRISDCIISSYTTENTNLDKYLQVFTSVYPNVLNIYKRGSVSIDFSQVANAQIDGFWAIGVKNWQILAGILLLEEAGGIVTDFKEKNNFLKNDYNDLVDIICTGNNRIHNELIALVS